MQYISPEIQKLISSKIKTANRELNVRVEVDKLGYNPDMTTEFHEVEFTTKTLPSAIVDVKNTEPTSASFICCPIKDKKFEECTITSEFGYREPVKLTNGGWSSSNHRGLDFKASTGTVLVAAADGSVVFAGKSGGYGNVIKIKHANEHMTVYAHLSKMYVGVGDKVIQNQPICEAGATGGVTAAHLHFEVRKGGTDYIKHTVDPRPYLEHSEVIQEVKSTVLTNATCNIKEKTKYRKLPRYDSPLRDEIERVDPSTGETVRGYLFDDKDLEVIEKQGEWYQVKVIQEQAPGINVTYYGYIHSSKLLVIVDQSDLPSTLTRRQSIIVAGQEHGSKINNDCIKMLFAICEHETVFGTDGAGLEINNSYILGYGVYGPGNYDPRFPGINEQMFRGYERYKEAMPSRGNRIRSIFDVYHFWCGGDKGHGEWQWSEAGGYYGVNPTQTQLESHEWVNNVWNYYNNGTDYLSEIPENYVTAPNTFTDGATVENATVNVYIQENDDSKVLTTINKGEYVEIISKGDVWTRVKTVKGTEGYVRTVYLKFDLSSVDDRYKSNTIFYDSFDGYSVESDLSNTKFTQTDNKGWRIKDDAGSSVLSVSGGSVGYDAIQFIVRVTNQGTLNINYKIQLETNNSQFEILDNSKLIYRDNGNEASYKEVSISLSAGSHVITLRRKTTETGINKINIDSLNVKEFLYLEDSSRDTKYISSTQKSIGMIRVTADDAPLLYYDDNTGDYIQFDVVERGSLYKEGSPYKAGGNEEPKYEIKYTDQPYEEIFILKEYCERVDKTDIYRVTKTGGFSFSETIILDNILSIDIDTKYGMDSAEAVIVLSNENGKYSPDMNPSKFPELGLNKSKLVDYYEGSPLSVLSENTPIRIEIGYGNKLQRRFTGLIDNVTENGENNTITIRCSDMMKKLDYTLYQDVSYPDETINDNVAWLASSVIHDMAVKSGMNNWRIVYSDISHPDIVVEESYYVELKPSSSEVIIINDEGIPESIFVSSFQDEFGYRNPYVFPINKTFKKGTKIKDNIKEICDNLGYWQRCDVYGTFYATLFNDDFSNKVAVADIKDTTNMIKISKSIDTTNIRNHLIISNGYDQEHFFDRDLWAAIKGERRTAEIVYPWANDYGIKEQIARKVFMDMKASSRTLQIAIEGNPYLELFDVINVSSKDVQVKDNYIIKGIRDSYAVDSGYITYLDMYWQVDV